jgi:hypothetical protein
MIFTGIIIALLAVWNLILSVIPTIPATPTAITSGGTWVINTITGVVALLNWIFTPTLLAAFVVVFIAIMGFEQIYHTTMWVVKKIPFLSIK